MSVTASRADTTRSFALAFWRGKNTSRNHAHACSRSTSERPSLIGSSTIPKSMPTPVNPDPIPTLNKPPPPGETFHLCVARESSDISILGNGHAGDSTYCLHLREKPVASSLEWFARMTERLESRPIAQAGNNCEQSVVFPNRGGSDTHKSIQARSRILQLSQQVDQQANMRRVRECRFHPLAERQSNRAGQAPHWRRLRLRLLILSSTGSGASDFFQRCAQMLGTK